MWVSRREFIELNKQVASAEGRAAAIEQQNVLLQSQIGWFTLRITQLEKERAQLLFQYTGVKVEYPRIETEDKSTPFDPMRQMPDFNDMGDDLAKEMGISWDGEGRVVYGKQKQA